MFFILKDYADIKEVATPSGTIKYIIAEIYDNPKITPDEAYTLYLRPLILDMLYKEYESMREPNQIYYISTMTNNEIAHNIGILGDMFHHKAFAKYDDTNEIRYTFRHKYEQIMFGGFTNYLLAKMNEDVKYKIAYCVNGIYEAGLTQKEIVLKYSGERLSGLLEELASKILENQKQTNNFMLETNFNKEFKPYISMTYQTVLNQEPPDDNYKLAWEFTFDEDFRVKHTDIDLDYCRTMLNENLKYKFIKSSGLDIFKEYETKLLSGELPDFAADLTELKKFYNGINSKTHINACINDMLYILKNISK